MLKYQAFRLKFDFTFTPLGRSNFIKASTVFFGWVNDIDQTLHSGNENLCIVITLDILKNIVTGTQTHR